VAKAERFMNKYGLQYVIDMDLSKCFDTLDHEIILKAVNKEISDGKVLKLILNFLKSGVMEGWIQTETEIGCPQGGPISPLLMNIYLNEFDQRMKSKGIRIVRYADDILVFARNKSEAGRNMAEATQILEQELKLKINKEKTHITEVEKGVAFLGFVIFTQCIKIHPKRVVKFKKRIKELTKRNRGTNLEQTIEEINPIIRGWANYFRIANCEGTFRNLMGWVRRRLRMKKMLEWKTWKPLHKQLRKLGYKGEFKKIYVKRWRNSASPLAQMALPNSWFDEMKLVNMARIKTGILSCYYE
jgi:RNA-directed DNA polymerase